MPSPLQAIQSLLDRDPRPIAQQSLGGSDVKIVVSGKLCGHESSHGRLAFSTSHSVDSFKGAADSVSSRIGDPFSRRIHPTDFTDFANPVPAFDRLVL